MKFMITLIIAINLFTSSFNNVSINEQKNNIIILNEDKTNKMNINDLIVTTLETDHLSGFSWQYEFSEPGIIDILFDNYIPGKDINNGPGKHTFIFKSLAKGKCQLIFNYYRQGENFSHKSVTYKIFVR